MLKQFTKVIREGHSHTTGDTRSSEVIERRSHVVYQAIRLITIIIKIKIIIHIYA